MDKAVLEFVVADGRPFEAVAGDGFKKLCTELGGIGYVPPHPTSLSRRLDDMRNQLHEKFAKTLKAETTATLCFLTFDHWKAANSSNYLVITIHYISADWTLQSRCLTAVNMEQNDADHTASRTAEIVHNELEKFGITEDNIFFCTMDTTNTMPCTTCRLEILWQACCAHVLQLSINAALAVQPVIKNLISHVHKIAGYFNSSTVGLRALHKHQEGQGLPQTSPPFDVLTRFNSTCILLGWIQKNKVAISLALVDCTTNKNSATTPPPPLTAQLHKTLEAAYPLLKPISEATTILSADASVSISLIVPCISTLIVQLRSSCAAGAVALRDELVKQLETRFDFEKCHLLAATFLDPRFKLVLFNDEQKMKAKSAVQQLFAERLSPTKPDATTLSVIQPIADAIEENALARRMGGLFRAVFTKVKINNLVLCNLIRNFI